MDMKRFQSVRLEATIGTMQTTMLLISDTAIDNLSLNDSPGNTHSLALTTQVDVRLCYSSTSIFLPIDVQLSRTAIQWCKKLQFWIDTSRLLRNSKEFGKQSGNG